MICPYNLQIETEYHFENCDYGEEGHLEKDRYTTMRRYIMAECLKENCGAYRNGECHYNG